MEAWPWKENFLRTYTGGPEIILLISNEFSGWGSGDNSSEKELSASKIIGSFPSGAEGMRSGGPEVDRRNEDWVWRS